MLKFLKALLYLSVGIYIFLKVSPVFSFIVLYVVILLFSGKDPEMKAEVQQHQAEMFSMFQEYFQGFFTAVPVSHVVYFLLASFLVFSLFFGMSFLVRELKGNKQKGAVTSHEN